jgi:hypothetical protein
MPTECSSRVIVYLLLLYSLVMISESASEGLSSVYSKLRGLKLIAFDLDGTIWTPGKFNFKLRNSK